MRNLFQMIPAASVSIAAATVANAKTAMHVGKTCGCNFYPTWLGKPARPKMSCGIRVSMVSCRTAIVEGYTRKGRVPPARGTTEILSSNSAG